MASVQLYSTAQGALVDFSLSVDKNGEIVAENGSEFIKFPAGLTKSQFAKLVAKHNKVNEGIVAIPEEELEAQAKAVEASQAIIDSLE